MSDNNGNDIATVKRILDLIDNLEPGFGSFYDEDEWHSAQYRIMNAIEDEFLRKH
jgi:hypothetical protein